MSTASLNFVSLKFVLISYRIIFFTFKLRRTDTLVVIRSFAMTMILVSFRKVVRSVNC